MLPLSLRVHEAALKGFYPVSKNIYKNEDLKQHFRGEKLCGDARDLVRIRPPTKIRPFRMPKSKISVDFLPVFFNETSVHNTQWLANLNSVCMVEVTIEQVIPVKAKLLFEEMP